MSAGESTPDPLLDFRKFQWLCWRSLGLPDPTELQYDMAWYLQHGPDATRAPNASPNDRLILEGFRGIAKSWTCGVFAAWEFYRDPQQKIMVVSASQTLASDMTNFVLDLFGLIPQLNHLLPKSTQRRSSERFDVGPSMPDKQASMKSVGIFGGLVGSRSDLIIADDVETDVNAGTVGGREKLKESIKQFDAILKPGGRIVYLGTPQTLQSIYNDLPGRGFDIRVWPARYPALEPAVAAAALAIIQEVREAQDGLSEQGPQENRDHGPDEEHGRVADQGDALLEEVEGLPKSDESHLRPLDLRALGLPSVPRPGLGKRPDALDAGALGDAPLLLPKDRSRGKLRSPSTVTLPQSLQDLLAGAENGTWLLRLSPLVLRRLIEDQSLSRGSIDPDFPGQPTEPGRFTDEDLMSRRLSWGRTGFALQYMLDTSLSDADRYPLKARDLVVLDLDGQVGPEKVVWGRGPDLEVKGIPLPGLEGDRYYAPLSIGSQMLPYNGAVMFVDPSGRGKDETAVAVVKMLHGQLFVTCVQGFGPSLGYEDEVLEGIAEIAKVHAVNLVLVEANLGQGMFGNLLKPHLRKVYPVRIDTVVQNRQKELRIIETLEPLMNQHRLIIDRAVLEKDSKRDVSLGEKALEYQLVHQLTHITRDRGSLGHDDRLDALAGACEFWIERLAQDVDQAAQASRDRMLSKELQRVLDHQVGGRRRARHSGSAGLLAQTRKRRQKGARRRR